MEKIDKILEQWSTDRWQEDYDKVIREWLTDNMEYNHDCEDYQVFGAYNYVEIPDDLRKDFLVDETVKILGEGNWTDEEKDYAADQINGEIFENDENIARSIYESQFDNSYDDDSYDRKRDEK